MAGEADIVTAALTMLRDSGLPRAVLTVRARWAAEGLPDRSSEGEDGREQLRALVDLLREHATEVRAIEELELVHGPGRLRFGDLDGSAADELLDVGSASPDAARAWSAAVEEAADTIDQFLAETRGNSG